MEGTPIETVHHPLATSIKASIGVMAIDTDRNLGFDPVSSGARPNTFLIRYTETELQRIQSLLGRKRRWMDSGVSTVIAVHAKQGSQVNERTNQSGSPGSNASEQVLRLTAKYWIP